MRSRRLALAAATTLGVVALTLGIGGTAQAAARPPLTMAECRASGGMVIPINVVGAVCLWQNPDGTIDSAQITDPVGIN
ncbi:hypothetical protein [Streptomyces hygroscopicus]|uniref:hypothetical protein n=1 Tax=Streptomyces hygroscopicus TaxID=1912 RepID=UPI00131DA4FB|nr:hypothetical protein [Streptomyces hygroscopicus]